jgi:hypothetical protein
MTLMEASVRATSARHPVLNIVFSTREMLIEPALCPGLATIDRTC